MQGPVITVDVSKGSCHYQPYVSNGHPMRKPKVLHDVEHQIKCTKKIKLNAKRNNVKFHSIQII